DERVHILPVQQNLHRLISSVYPSVNDTRTDDRGIYRVYGLPAGTYKVRVGDPQFGAFSSISGRRFYPQTFHPNVTDEAKAQLVEVAEGSEVNGIDITVARALTGYSASGRFVDANNGQTVPNISFGLTVVSDTNSSRGYVSIRNVSAGNGSFQIDNLPPGTYAVSVLSGSTSGYYGASESFSISDADVTDIEVRVQRGATISGNVVVAGIEDRSILAKLSRTRLQAYTFSEGNSVGAIIYSDINADGSFQIGPLRPGKLTIVLTSLDGNVTPDFALLAIDHNGVDKSQGIQLKEGEDLSGLRLLLGYGTGVIRGTVHIEGGTLPAGTYIGAAVIRPGSPLTISHTQVDERGRFLFERMPPGNYEVGVNAYRQGRVISARQAVVTSNGVTTEITVTLNVGTNPKPGP
ncbi:MAG TPA: hypothetical protein VFI57_13775, partial [Pyrinomonadaceae bacterium]|nr:hypothetical protein [Pyrinomonadaceae bacterium]